MDNVTHTLIGVGVANAFLRKRAGAASVPILAIASNLPDIDILVHITGDPAAVTLRRSFGHSLLLLPVWCLLLAWILRRIWPRLGLRTHFGLAVLGSAVHLVFDLVNSFGVLLLWPVSIWRPELAMVFIIDLALALVVVLPLAVCIPRRMRRLLTPLSRAAMAGVIVYLCVCAGGRLMARDLLNAAAGGTPGFAYVFPEPLGPHRWRGVTRHGAAYDLWLLRPFTGAADRVRAVANDRDDPAVAAARASPLGVRLERFFKAPVWEASPQAGDPGAGNPAPGDRSVCVSDLRFRSIVLDRGTAFRFCFRVLSDGTVERADDRLLAPPG